MITDWLKPLESVFGWLLEASWQASVLALMVLAVQWLFRSRLNPRWRYALWLLVLLRLMLPVLPESAWSLFQFAPQAPASFTVPVTEPLFLPAHEPLPQAPLLVTKPTEPLSFYSLLALAWLAGTLTLLVFTWEVNRRFARQIRKSPEISDPELLELFVVARAELNVTRSIRLIENAQVQTPAIMGLFHPTLLLPADVRGKFDPTELRLIFLHELAHLKRGDVIVQWLIALLQIVHWFNPVLWFAFRRMRADREPATDALVLSRAGENEKERYGLMLIKLLEHFNQRHSLPTLVGILEDKDQFKHRFSLIARFTKGAYGWSLLGALVLLILAMTGLTKKPFEPKTYTATALIQIWPQSDSGRPPEIRNDSNRLSMSAIEVMQSEDVLLPVIRKLELDKIWAKRDFKSTVDHLPSQVALDYMRKKVLTLNYKGGTNILEISARNQDPQEAADIANAVASQYKTLTDNDINQHEDKLENTFRTKIESQQKLVDEKKALLEQFPSGTDKTSEPYLNASHQYLKQQSLLDAYTIHLKELVLDTSLRKSPVNIIPSNPPPKPVNENSPPVISPPPAPTAPSTNNAPPTQDKSAIDQGVNHEIETRKRDLLTAREDADSRRVLMEQVKDLSDNDFLNTMIAIQRKGPSLSADPFHNSINLSEISKQESEIDNMLKAGYAESDPRVESARAELARQREQITEMIAGMRRAVQVDVEMANARVAHLSKEVDKLTARTSTPSQMPPTVAMAASSPNMAQPVQDKTLEQTTQSQVKVSIVITGKDLKDWKNMKFQDRIMNVPTVSQINFDPTVIKMGTNATIQSVNEFPYPMSFEKPQVSTGVKIGEKTLNVAVPPTPREFVTEDVGWSIQMTSELHQGIIELQATSTYTAPVMHDGPAFYGEHSGPSYTDVKDPKTGKINHTLLTENKIAMPTFQKSVTPLFIMAQPGKEYTVKLQCGSDWVDATIKCDLM